MKVKKHINYSILVIVMIGVILLGMVVNTILLYNDTQKAIHQYLYDNNSIIAKSMSDQMKAKIEPMEDFASSLVRMPEKAVTDRLLEQKRVSFDIDSIAIFNVNNNQLMHHIGETEKINQYVKNQDNQLTKELKVIINEDNILFLSIPIKSSDKVEKILIGSKSLNEIPMDASKSTVTFLVNTNANSIISIKKGEESSIKDKCIENTFTYFQKHGYRGIYKDSRCFAVVDVIEGTSCASISMMSYDDWMPMLFTHILSYGFLIVLVLVVFVFCVHQFKKETKRYEKVYLTDPLTGGLNRNGFIKRINEIVKDDDYKNYYVLCLDISEFRYINESWGDKAGDRTLLFVYRMISENINRSKEFVCRSNIDRFLLFICAHSEEEINQRVEKFIIRTNKHIHRSFLEYNLHFTVGACHLSLAENMTSAINNAVYVSRNATVKDKCVFYSQEMIEKKQSDIELNNIFYDSLNNHDFSIYLQPKVSQTGECHAEALVRWIHREKGIITPNLFIPLFEQNGKIVELDLYVFEETCRLISKWRSEQSDVSSVSVNISRHSIMNAGENIYLQYKKIKDKYDIPDGLIEIELTETVLLSGNQIGFVKKIVENFKSCGMKVALDDFGFAYSSLGILKSLDVDTVKLDQSFLKDTTIKSEKIIKSVIQLAHNLGMEVVAEGVEEKVQVDMLYQSDCDFIQGYYYSKPLSIDEFEVWRREYKKNIK